MTVGSQVRGCFSSIKSAEATLEVLANKTKSQEAKEAFANTGNVLTEIKNDLEKQVIALGIEEPQYKS